MDIKKREAWFEEALRISTLIEDYTSQINALINMCIYLEMETNERLDEIHRLMEQVEVLTAELTEVRKKLFPEDCCS